MRVVYIKNVYGKGGGVNIVVDDLKIQASLLKLNNVTPSLAGARPTRIVVRGQ